MTHAAYLVAEWATHADELRNPHTAFSRDQLADLAECSRRDPAALGTMPIVDRPVPRCAPAGEATIIPFRR